jgi:hypothetical protein
MLKIAATMACYMLKGFQYGTWNRPVESTLDIMLSIVSLEIQASIWPNSKRVTKPLASCSNFQ